MRREKGWRLWQQYRGHKREREVGEAGEGTMGINGEGGDLTWGMNIQYTDDVLQNCIPETYIISLNDVIPIIFF